MPSDPHIVIVGAGAAGIGAAMACAARGIPYVVLEAADRVGGRALTDAEDLPGIWDKGCHWLHCAEVNPLVPHADRLGAVYDTASRDDTFATWSGGAFLTGAELSDCDAAIEAAFAATYAAGEAGHDGPITDVLPDLGRWAPHARAILQLLVGDDPECDSASAYADYDDTGHDWPVRSGYGALITAMARGLDIRTGVAVTAISRTGEGARVETTGGTLDARAVIVTCSTSVLASGAIRIDAGEPAARVLDTIAHMPCGSFEKVAFALDALPPGMDGKEYLLVDTGADDPVVEFQVVGGAQPMMICNIAGTPARDLAAMPPRARVDFALARLRAAFGTGIARAVIHTGTTDWTNDPLILGSYSRTDPGHAEARRDAIAADTGRVAFAGEAFSLDWQATAHGAWQSGQDVANRLARRIAPG
ncbi:NAD(P)/FAD-dependent oxidoreductase [Roseovarius sp. SCSIO 43702]|uniref:flavin monoamine oxidase family protein n=1 Tax=Roseovarius sp. SCSIO 43702 TaxID=2823043 RepID=UPI00217590B2|nr:NAD(P)/FAD-dependent oxidoreductase [Roseovarius sp. SCSIO 43702]